MPPIPGTGEEEMSFDAAFNEATNTDQPPAEPAVPPVETVVVAGGDELSAAPAGETPAEPPAEPAAPASAEPIAQPPAEPVAPAPQPSGLSGDDAAELARLRAAEAEWKKQPPAEPAAEPAPAAATPAEEKPVLTDAEKAKVEEYKSDWPDVAQAEELLRKEMSENLKAEVYTAVGQVLQQMYSMFKPLLGEYQVTSATRRDAAITAQIADYPQIKGALEAWVSKQPAPIAKAYKETLDTGSINDVSSVVSLYKQAVGQTTPQTTPPTAPPAAPALEPVQSGRRTAPVTTESNPNDFEAAWADAIKQVH